MRAGAGGTDGGTGTEGGGGGGGKGKGAAGQVRGDSKFGLVFPPLLFPFLPPAKKSSHLGAAS